MKNIFGKTAKRAMPVGRRGFSLLEVMLAIFILSTTLVVFIQVITKSIFHSLESRDSIIAANLAQEGVELVKNIRDNNWAKKTDGFSGTNPINNGSYAVNYSSNALVALGTGRLKWDNSYYNSSAGIDSKFSRKITIGGTPDIKTVTSYVIWNRSGFPSSPSMCNISGKCVYATIMLTQWGGE